MRKFIACSAFLLLSLSACSSHISDFRQEQAEYGEMAESIAEYLTGLEEIEDCTVQIDGAAALVAINLAGEYSDEEIIGLKRRIAADIRGQNSQINHVTITTAPDMYEKTHGTKPDSPEERRIDKELDKNRDKEIFTDMIPTA